MKGPSGIAPIHATISDVEVVTIPATHYAELLNCQRQLAATPAAVAPRRVKIDSRSRLFDDPEVADFLMGIMGTMRLTEARQACIERFGINRAPSRATIGRFWQRRRGAR